MEIAIISDIHSNSFALHAVLNDIKKRNIDRLIVLGDIFGYYPWASQTYKLLLPYLNNSFFIKGNHDQLVLDKNPPKPEPSYWKLAQSNKKELQDNAPEALEWLNTLTFSSDINLYNNIFHLFHGTPSDRSNGRFYPDSVVNKKNFPDIEGYILLGHTHYPLLKSDRSNKYIIFNPGSVGQPRDGDPNPSWGVFDTESKCFSFERSLYDYCHSADLLRQMNWDEHAIAAIQKKHAGPLFNKNQTSN